MIDPCPCKGCTERFPACSGKCPKDARGEYGYKAWKEQYQAQKRYTEKNKMRLSIPSSNAREQRQKHNLKHHKQNGGIR